MNEDEPRVLVEAIKQLDRLIRSVRSLPLRPPYPSITSPGSGDAITAGPLLVRVTTNRPDLAHTVKLLSGDLGTVHDTQGVTFDTPTSGFANITAPDLGTDEVDFVIECRATTGSIAMVLVKIPAAIPPTMTVTISANAVPPFTVGQVVRFTANPVGGLAPRTWIWSGTDVAAGTMGDFIDVTFTAAVLAGKVKIIGEDSTLPSPLIAFSKFGPFDVN